MTVIALVLTAGAMILYLVIGTFTDWRRARLESQREFAMNALTESAFLDHDSAGAGFAKLRNVPSKVLWGLALTVPLHFDDHLSRRIVSIIGATKARTRISRLSRSAFWFRRVRAARLAHVLHVEDSEIVERLLGDSSTSVQAATIESFGSDQIARHARVLLERLNHPMQSVRFTAQQALLRGDGRITEPLSEWLARADEDVAHFGLEVAANLDDPRLVGDIKAFSTSRDPLMRRLVAQATPVGVGREDLQFFEALVQDPDSRVRATAIESSTRIDADWLLPRVAEGLSDPAWKVRRAAGSALSKSGALGNMYLRAARTGHDPYAADMASYFLELTGRLEELRIEPLEDEVDSLLDWAQR